MKINKMPANGEYLSWDPERIQEYDQWIELEIELKRTSWLKPQTQRKLENAVSTIRNRIIQKGKRI
jgi:hypothetical protein